MHILARRRDLQSIASEVGIRFGAVQSILTDILHMSKVLARWVPRMLTDDQKRTRLDISMLLLSRYEDDPGDFIERFVTQDYIWVHYFDPVKNAEQTMEVILDIHCIRTEHNLNNSESPCCRIPPPNFSSI